MSSASTQRAEVTLIVAASRNRVIGRDNDLPWNLPVDMQFFKENTKGYPVIMGRKNFDSIPEKYRPLPGRKNIVITRQESYQAGEGISVCNDINSAIALAAAEEKDKTFVIGGGQIYALAMQEDLIDKMLITWIDVELQGDAHFPKFDESKWSRQTLMHHPADDRHDYAMQMVEYTRK